MLADASEASHAPNFIVSPSPFGAFNISSRVGRRFRRRRNGRIGRNGRISSSVIASLAGAPLVIGI